MYDSSRPQSPTRPARSEPAPQPADGLAVLAGFAAVFPLTLLAIAHPAVAAATATGVAIGLLARPLFRRLTRRTAGPRSARHERPGDGVDLAATRE
ncbi:hypothetical protein [Halorussus sp. AFM4]|uniref:hypothetical protein n=1 Tax=Halorussus sp. AFM4 TaxID=3421651 RepID=UPI003EBD0F40